MPEITQCRIILYRLGPGKYAPALVNEVNPDGSVNLTVFMPFGVTEGVQNVFEGHEVGDWAWPGVDAGKEHRHGEEEKEATSEAKGQG